MRNIITFEQVNLVLGEFISPAGTMRRYSLDRMYQLMYALGNPQDSLNVIHVAGTSGKTSTSYYIASLLQEAGFKTGLTVSPHIDEVNERAQVGMTPLPEAEFCNEFSLFMDILDTSNINPTYFELLIAFSLWLFHKRKVDYAVVEVGIGGLLDSTNIFSQPDKICVITDIGLDHTEILGDTIDKIAMQKAGIIKPKNEVFMNLQSAEIIGVVKKQCQAMEAPFHIVNTDVHMSNLPLFQRRNFNLAQNVVKNILVRDGHIELSDQKNQVAASIVIPARMEIVKFQGKMLVLDGSHNEQKIGSLVESMKNRFPNQKINLLVSFGETKRDSALAGMKLLSQLGQNIVVTDYSYDDDSVKRALRVEDLAEIAEQAGFQSITVQPNPKLAFKAFVSDVDDIGLVTGSFYLMNPVRDIVFNK